jgi:hypothetical protein
VKPSKISGTHSTPNPEPFTCHPRSSNRLNSQIETLEQRLYELNNDFCSFDGSLKTLRHERQELALSGGDPNFIHSLDRVISNKIEQYAWKQKESEQVRQKLTESRKRVGFTRVERAFLALFKDPMAPIQNVTNASTIAGTSNASEDELISALATISYSTNHAPNEGSDAAENTMPPIDLLWNSLNAMNQANILTPRTNVTATAVTPNNAVRNSMESPASVFYEATQRTYLLKLQCPIFWKIFSKHITKRMSYKNA